MLEATGDYGHNIHKNRRKTLLSNTLPIRTLPLFEIHSIYIFRLVLSAYIEDVSRYA